MATTINIYFPLVLVGQKFGSGLAVQFWLGVSHEAAVKSWGTGIGLPSCGSLMRAESSVSKVDSAYGW